ncbi:hypothetical protein GDO81_013176 [Engystomops pustulosus]|uniref:B30.2/SPRY domain-containing protein n=1 Tax=Engystomops pustulosus TaxID=76066 RepID=A0AAV7AXH4_ENGPU|nr:hypothetical protein GDO81_013176 [Engystomops pustulosus]
MACSVTTEEDAPIGPPQGSQPDDPQHNEKEKSPSSPLLQEDEEAQVFHRKKHLVEVAWKRFEDYEKKLHTTRFLGDLQREKIKKSYHHLHQHMIKEEETHIANAKGLVETSIKNLEGKVQSLSSMSTGITDILVLLEKEELVIDTETLQKFRNRLEELSRFNVTLNIHTSPFLIQEWRGIKHIVKPMAKSLYFEPKSANPYLSVSPNCKQVRYTCHPQPKSNNDFFEPGLYVIALPGFQSGQHYWEVDVGHKSNWIIGIMKDVVPKKGPHNLNISSGFLVVRKEDDNVYYGCDLSPLKLMDSPMRIGVYVSVSRGYIAFYDADTTKLIFQKPECFFAGTLFPFFCPGVPLREEDLYPLSLCY